MKWRDVPVPSRMAKLPKDHRGYPIPANVYRDGTGNPHFTINDQQTRLRQMHHDLCPICGDKLPRGRWFCGGPLSAFHPQGVYIDLPMHHECAAYALQVCPYLALASYRGRIDDATIKKVPEKDRGDVMFFDPTLIPERPILFVLGMAIGQRTNIQYVYPQMPWHRIEFWKDGVRLDHREGKALAMAALAGNPDALATLAAASPDARLF